MPTQVLPVTEIAKAGVIMDTPSVSLPPNVFSNVENVRFRDGAVRKMEGEMRLFPHTNVAYVAYWRGPFNEMYVVLEEDGDIWLYNLDGTMSHQVGEIRAAANADARPQHTLFNGGHNFILNDGVSTPVYLTDTEDMMSIANAAPLPNWDSYLTQENVVSVIWDNENADISLGRSVSLDLVTGTTVDMAGTDRILFRIIPRNNSLPILTQTLSRLVRLDNTGTYTTPVGSLFTIQDPMADVWEINPTPRDSTASPPVAGAEEGDTIEISIQQRPEIIVTAGVIRAYGNLLVAGNLRETDTSGVILRSIPGTIRTSDVAPPGNVPANWNPFRNGANTADEFTLSSTGTVQDMVELQGNLFIYSTNSIHSLQQTGGVVPFSIRPVTDAYGADNTGSVLEVDGKHIVVGSDDVYVFGGHPGSIQSIADARVRQQGFFNTPGNDVRILRYNRFDELWFYTPNQSQMYIWNYRDNTWTVRNQTTPTVGNSGPNTLIFADATGIYRTMPGEYTKVEDGMGYRSFIERKRLAITPEFTTETLVSIGILSEGSASFEVAAVGTERPAQTRTLPTDDPTPTPFVSQSNYKADIRTHGRLLNYRITDTTDVEWSIAGLQFDIGAGGTR